MSLASRTSGGCVRAGVMASGSVGVLAVDNFKKRNALCGAGMVSLREGFEALKREGVAAVVICGAKGRFCSGAEMPTLVGGGFQEYMQVTFDTMRSSGPVTYALMEGHAIGGGAEMALAADQRIWTDTSSLQFVQTKMGITTGWGGTKYLAETVGRSTAIKLLTTAYAVKTYEEAKELQLADYLLSLPKEAEDVTLEGVGPMPLSGADAKAMLTPLALHAVSYVGSLHQHTRPSATCATKAILAANRGQRFQAEQSHFTRLWRGPDHNAALEAVFKVGKA